MSSNISNENPFDAVDLADDSNLLTTSGNLPPDFIGSKVPIEPTVTLSLMNPGECIFSEYRVKIQARSKPLDESCLVIFDPRPPVYITQFGAKDYGASWYVMRFKDKEKMLAYAKTRKSYKGDIALPYDEDSFADIGFAF